MTLPTYTPIPLRWWCVAVIALAGWNTGMAFYASPTSMTQGYDGTQYQLLARNRLAGHYEVGDTAHTVRLEGSHPMWRPGLVWLTEGVARLTASVREAAIILSVIATTLLEIALLWLIWRCFGRAAWGVALTFLFLPFSISVIFMLLAMGQGPEPWAALFTVSGLALLVAALGRQSWALALVAAATAASAELFRTGNLLLFTVPLAVFAASALYQRSLRSAGVCGVALAGYFATGLAIGYLTASPVNKTVANLRGSLVEHDGDQIVVQYSGDARQVHYFGGLAIVPETGETEYDRIVRSAHHVKTSDFLAEHGEQILQIYADRLVSVGTEGARGLRAMAGESVLLFFVVAVVLGIWRAESPTTAALAGGFLAHFFGPVVLLCGALASHYLYPAFPLLFAVSCAGVVQLGRWIVSVVEARFPEIAPQLKTAVTPMAVLGIAVLTWMSFQFYAGAIASVRADYAEAAQDQADIDALNLEGKRIAVRHMAWFVDRNVGTMLLPYATVRELEQYAATHDFDGLLFRIHSKSPFFCATPHGSTPAFEQALQESGRFEEPRISGLWRWYAVRRPSEQARR